MNRHLRRLAEQLFVRPRLLDLIAVSIGTLLVGSIVATLAQLLRVAWAQWSQPLLTQDSWVLTQASSSRPAFWLLAQHNEHRIVFAKLAAIIDVYVLGVPPSSSFLFQTLAVLLLCFGLLALLCRWMSASPILAFSTWVAGVAILMNPWQWENFSWEFQLPWFHVNSLCLLATLALAHTFSASKRQSKAVSTFCLLLIPWFAMFSSGQGISLAAALVVVAWLLSHRLFLGMALSSISALAIYFPVLGFQKPSYHPGLSLNPDYFSRLISGGSWSGLSFIAMALLTMTMVFSLLKGVSVSLSIKQKLIIGCLPGLFAVLFSLMTTLSRAGFGLGQATSSRYVTHTLLLPLSFLLVWECLAANSGLLRDLARHRLIAMLAPVIVLYGTLLSFPQILFSNAPSSFRENLGLISLARYKNEQIFRCLIRSTGALTKRQRSNTRPDRTDCAPYHQVVEPLVRRYFQAKSGVPLLGWHRTLAGSVSNGTDDSRFPSLP